MKPLKLALRELKSETDKDPSLHAVPNFSLSVDLGIDAVTDSEVQLIGEEVFESFWAGCAERIRHLILYGRGLEQSPYLWHIFDYIGDLGDNQKLELTIQTDLDFAPATLDWFILKTHYVKRLSLKLDPTVSMPALQQLVKFGRLHSINFSDPNSESSPALTELKSKLRPGFFIDAAADLSETVAP